MRGPNVFHAVTGVRTKTILSTIIKTLSQNLAAPVWLASSSGRDLLRLWGPELRFLGDSLLYLHRMFVTATSLCFLYLVSLCLVLGPLLPPLGIPLSPPLIFTAVLYGSCIIWIYISNLSTLCTAKLHCRSQAPQWQAQNNSWTTSSSPFSSSDTVKMMNNSLIFHLPQSKNK